MSENVGDETSITSYSLQLNLTENLEDDLPFKDVTTINDPLVGDNISTNTKTNILTFPLLTSNDIIPNIVPIDQSKTSHLIEQQQDINKILDKSNKKENLMKKKKRKLNSIDNIKGTTDNQSDDDDDNSNDEDYITNNKKLFHFSDKGIRTRSQDTQSNTTIDNNNTDLENLLTTENEDNNEEQDCFSNLGSQIGSIQSCRPHARTQIGEIAVDVPVPVIKLR